MADEVNASKTDALVDPIFLYANGISLCFVSLSAVGIAVSGLEFLLWGSRSLVWYTICALSLTTFISSSELFYLFVELCQNFNSEESYRQKIEKNKVDIKLFDLIYVAFAAITVLVGLYFYFSTITHFPSRPFCVQHPKTQVCANFMNVYLKKFEVYDIMYHIENDDYNATHNFGFMNIVFCLLASPVVGLRLAKSVYEYLVQIQEYRSKFKCDCRAKICLAAFPKKVIAWLLKYLRL